MKKTPSEMTDNAPTIFAPLAGDSTDRIMDAIEKLKKIPSNLRWTDGKGNILIDHEVQKAIKADVTGLSAALMVAARAKEFGSDITFTANEVLNMSEKDLAMLRRLKEIQETPDDPDINGPIVAFQKAICDAAVQYGLLTDAVRSVIDDPEQAGLFTNECVVLHRRFRGAPIQSGRQERASVSLQYFRPRV